MKKNIITILMLLLVAYQANAQLAVVNSQKVIASIPEFAKIDTAVTKETASYAAEYNKKQAALNLLVKNADSLYKIDMKAANTTKAIAEAQTADKDLKAFGETANKKIAEYKQLLTKPYIEKIMAAIKVVALRGKYMQVIDSSAVNLLYVSPLTDITEQVIKELKLK